jgi:hypothetical protein
MFIKRKSERDKIIPREQCHKNCNEHNRAGRKERVVAVVAGPVKRKLRMKRTFFFFFFLSLFVDSSLSPFLNS